MNSAHAEIRWSHLAIIFLVAFLLGVGVMGYLQAHAPGFWPWGVDVYSNWLGARLIWQFYPTLVLGAMLIGSWYAMRRTRFAPTEGGSQ